MDFFVCHDPKQHLELLLLADPYEPMIDRYLPQSIVLTAMEKGKTVGLIAYCPVAGGGRGVAGQRSGPGTGAAGQRPPACRYGSFGRYSLDFFRESDFL